MDLGICPRCGRQWPGGEYCPYCGFIPIGAGLSRLPKRRKKKIKPYREPGSATPLLVFLAMIGGIGSVYQSKPWEDGWDRIRALFGHPRIHDIQGNWAVVKTLDLSTSANGFFQFMDASQASMSFEPPAGVTIKVVQMDRELDLKGTYEVDGTTIHVRNLFCADDTAPKFSKSMDMELAWNGDDEMVASIPNETVYMDRQTAGASQVAIERDRITTSYANNESNPHGELIKPAGGGP